MPLKCFNFRTGALFRTISPQILGTRSRNYNDITVNSFSLHFCYNSHNICFYVWFSVFSSFSFFFFFFSYIFKRGEG